jgi:signal transduction histidine kinase
LNLAALNNKLHNNPDAEELVAYLQKLSRQISVGIYQLMRDLRPIQLDELGLGPAIQYLADQAQQHNGIKIHIEIKGNQMKLDPSIENVLFRVSGRQSIYCQALVR